MSADRANRFNPRQHGGRIATALPLHAAGFPASLSQLTQDVWQAIYPLELPFSHRLEAHPIEGRRQTGVPLGNGRGSLLANVEQIYHFQHRRASLCIRG